MNELTLVVHAFAADVLVPVILSPRLLRVLKLPPHPMPPHLRQNRPHPVVKHSRLQLKPDPKPHRLVIHPSDQGQRVVTPHEPPLEEIHFPLRPKNRVVQLHRPGKHLFIRNVNISLSHERKPPREIGHTIKKDCNPNHPRSHTALLSPLPTYSWGEHSLSPSASFGTRGEGQSFESKQCRQRRMIASFSPWTVRGSGSG